MISHPHRCIFIHIPKTGGSSIEHVIWPPESRTEADLHRGFVRPHHNKYQTGGLQHLLARQVRQEVGEAVFDACFKFTIVRNPWDRLVSQYASMSRREDLREFVGMDRDCPFDRYLDLIAERLHVQWAPQVDFFRDLDGQVLVDRIGRFETLAEEAAAVFTRIGLTGAVLPHKKRSARSAYRDYYDARTRRIVEDRYAEDIAVLGYAF